VFGLFSAFIAPWLMGAIVNASGGSFVGAFGFFVVMEVIFLLLLMVLARDTVSRPSIVANPAE
jgi:MFS-type transporter involved in bile tolerance (Atg22 family)